MPDGLIDSEVLTEATRELCELAATLNPDAAPAELLDLAAAAVGTLSQGQHGGGINNGRSGTMQSPALAMVGWRRTPIRGSRDR